MEILGIGWQELIFIVIIVLIVLGPKDMQKAGRTIGRLLNQLVQSDSWKLFQRTSSELRNLPRNLMREANMEIRQTESEIRRAIDPRLDPSASRLPSGKDRYPSEVREDSPGPAAGTAKTPTIAPKGREAEDGTGDTQEPGEYV